MISTVVDWLQLHCRHRSKISNWNFEIYDVKKKDYGTKIFEDVEYIFRKGRLLATCCSKPRSAVIPADTCIVKFENDVLYDNLLDWQVKEFLHYNKLEFIGISRLDIASDFTKFANGKDPESLIHSFLRGKIVKMGKGKFKVHGEVGRFISHDYLRFGGKDSPISVYLYNKTKELQQVKMKPHIVEQWDKVGIDVSTDVWRLEVSIKGTKKVLRDCRENKEFDFYSLDIISEENIFLLWSSTVEKYFDFAIENLKESNKSRLQRIELFKDLPQHGCVIERTNKKESNHMDKYFSNKLHSLFEELKGTADDLSDMALDVKKYFISSRDIDRRKKLATDKLRRM